MGFKTDIEIAQETVMSPITEDRRKGRDRREVSGTVRKI